MALPVLRTCGSREPGPHQGRLPKQEAPTTRSLLSRLDAPGKGENVMFQLTVTNIPPKGHSPLHPQKQAKQADGPQILWRQPGLGH